MFTGNHKRLTFWLLALLLVAVLGAGITLSYLTDGTGKLENTFLPASVTVEIKEDLGETKENVRITNTGDTSCYIRAMVAINWQDEVGNVLGETPQEGTDYTIRWGSESWDRDTADGLFYYTQPVPAGGQTENLINEVAALTGKKEGYRLTVEITAAAIQSSPVSAVVEKWGVTLAADGKTISK